MRKHGRDGRRTDAPQQQTVRVAGLPERPQSRLSCRFERGAYLWRMQREPLN